VPLNLGHLRSFVGDDLPTLRHYLGLFVTSAGAMLAQLGPPITVRDLTVANGLAHKLKGLCGTVGAEQMTELSVRMEQALLAESWTDADRLRAELHQAFARARAEAEAV
jgi:HPt (histidine-containing phosphotransfer) domain-containing protein